MFTIQNLVLPHLNSLPPEKMYIRGEYWLNRNSKQLNILKGKHSDLGTYFNCLSVKVWKIDCDIQTINLLIKGQGKLHIEFVHHNCHDQEIVVAEQQLDLNTLHEQIIPLYFWQSLNEGLVYIRLLGISDATIDQLAYVTHQPPKTSVRLGAVITHFNRQPYVCQAAQRIEQELLSDPNYKNIKLIIVDNSQNLNLSFESNNIKIIKNKNVGGSGGFTRGLLELKDRNFTHCCFMDDDASCDIEALRRTYAFFSYAKKDIKWGLSGNLLIDQYPDLIHEAGATFYRGRYISVGHHLNATNLNDVTWINQNGDRGNYGAWCYFAFTISDIAHYAYPFFVRGDDIFFSIQNNLKIESINGVCTWIDDFSVKDSPITRYLAARATLTITLLQNKMSLSRFIKIFWNLHRGALNAYLYDSCTALEESVLDVLKGPQIYFDDINGTKFREKLNPLQKAEALTTPSRDVKFDHPKKTESGFQHIIRKLSFNGLLIPSFFFKQRTVLQPKAYGASSSQIFAYKNIYYLDRSIDKGLICTYDKIKVIKHLITRCIITTKIIANYKGISDKYQSKLDNMTSENFWRKIFM